MNFKLDYVTRVLQKTSKKRIENYVISRIWHLLNNDEIKISHQQHVDRGQGQRAMTDLYFPQIYYHIEVDEEYHTNNKEHDQARESEIIKQTGHTVRRVNCSNVIDLKEIHGQIDEIVKEINDLVKTKKESSSFIPWSLDELTPEFWKNRGILRVTDNVNLTTIDDIGRLFNVKIANRGYLKAGAARYDKDGFSEVWWPSENIKSNWQNLFENNFERITEKNLVETKGNNHVQNYVNNNPSCKRIVFFKYKDELGFDFYKFVGCFKLNSGVSSTENQLVWERFSDSYEIKHANKFILE